jgi:hypothetical protein
MARRALVEAERPGVRPRPLGGPERLLASGDTIHRPLEMLTARRTVKNLLTF